MISYIIVKAIARSDAIMFSKRPERSVHVVSYQP